VRIKDFQAMAGVERETPAHCARKRKLMALAKGVGRERW
jgi:hypothetical protein